MKKELCVTNNGFFVLVPETELVVRLGKNGDLDCIANPQFEFRIMAYKEKEIHCRQATISQIEEMIRDGFKVRYEHIVA